MKDMHSNQLSYQGNQSGRGGDDNSNPYPPTLVHIPLIKEMYMMIIKLFYSIADFIYGFDKIVFLINNFTMQFFSYYCKFFIFVK